MSSYRWPPGEPKGQGGGSRPRKPVRSQWSVSNRSLKVEPCSVRGDLAQWLAKNKHLVQARWMAAEGKGIFPPSTSSKTTIQPSNGSTSHGHFSWPGIQPLTSLAAVAISQGLGSAWRGPGMAFLGPLEKCPDPRVGGNPGSSTPQRPPQGCLGSRDRLRFLTRSSSL